MTTEVEVTTHNWPVQVVAVDKCVDGSLVHTPLKIIEPNSKSEHLYVTNTRSFIITEMKAPK